MIVEFLVLLFIFAIIGSFYFLPSIIAKVWKQKNFTAILILNLFLGWSFIGWVIALVWAFKHES